MISKWLGLLVLPPAGNLLVFLFGLGLSRRVRWLGRLLMVLAGASLLAISLPVVSGMLMRGLEPYPALPAQGGAIPAAEAIVVLGGGRRKDAPEYGGDTVSHFGLERLRYAARLYRRVGMPVLVSGGSVFGEPSTEAALMKAVMVEDLHVPVAWTEEQSRNTWENAVYSRQLLAAEGIHRIYLVTHAWHMPRAVQAFRAAGFEVVPAPTGFEAHAPAGLDWQDFVPSSGALYTSTLAMHEWLGRLWYALRYE